MAQRLCWLNITTLRHYLNQLAECVLPGPDSVTYTLTRSVLAFSKSEHKLTKLPAGAVVELDSSRAEWRNLGLVNVLYEGQQFFVFAQDVGITAASEDEGRP